MLFSGRWSEWNPFNLFLDRLSFLNCGIVPKLAKSKLGSTNVLSLLRLLEDRLSSYRADMKERLFGMVHNSLDAISRVFNLLSLPNSVK